MKRKNIVVVEDDQAIRDIIAYVLLSEGYEPLGCDKLEPLSGITRYRPELIILDEWVNAREGTMLCQEIKKDPRAGSCTRDHYIYFTRYRADRPGLQSRWICS